MIHMLQSRGLWIVYGDDGKFVHLHTRINGWLDGWYISVESETITHEISIHIQSLFIRKYE